MTVPERIAQARRWPPKHTWPAWGRWLVWVATFGLMGGRCCLMAAGNLALLLYPALCITYGVACCGLIWRSSAE